MAMWQRSNFWWIAEKEVKDEKGRVLLYCAARVGNVQAVFCLLNEKR